MLESFDPAPVKTRKLESLWAGGVGSIHGARGFLVVALDLGEVRNRTSASS
jgi:hypothetical protein